MNRLSSTAPARLAVIGAGAWGTVLSLLLARGGHRVALWTRRPEHARELAETRENRAYLPGPRLPDGIRPTADPDEAVRDAEALFVALPSQGLREVLERLPPAPAVVSCTKGLEAGSFRRVSEIVAEYQPRALLAALSGPNLAREIADGHPAAATVASRDADLAARAQAWLQSDAFRVYTSHDLTGVEIGGAVKNVIALAAGMSDGLELGDNAKASIITRGLAEIVRLGRHLGGARETFYGLAGLGDMVATCASTGSRNHTAGVRIARGATLAELQASRLTAEGIPTVRAVVEHARGAGLELPIAAEVHEVVYGGKDPREAIRSLMRREVKAEW